MATLSPLPKSASEQETQHLAGDKIQPGHPLFGIVSVNPRRVSGAPCFYHSRVPVKTLFDCFAAGQSLDEFLDDFEGVTCQQAIAVLHFATTRLLDDLNTL